MGKDRLPTIHFQVRAVSFREGNLFFCKEKKKNGNCFTVLRLILTMIFQNGHVDITLVVGKQPSPHRWGKRPEDVVHKNTAGSRNWQGEFWINTINGYFGCKFAGAQFCGEKVHPLKINMLNTKLMVFSDEFRIFKKVIFRFQPIIFQGGKGLQS